MFSPKLAQTNHRLVRSSFGRLVSFYADSFDNFAYYRQQAKAIEISSAGDVPVAQELVFPKTETVFFTSCDKNFVVEWLKPQIFPNLKKIYLNSNPGDELVLARFSAETEIYLVDKWAKSLGKSGVFVISEQEYQDKKMMVFNHRS